MFAILTGVLGVVVVAAAWHRRGRIVGLVGAGILALSWFLIRVLGPADAARDLALGILLGLPVMVAVGLARQRAARRSRASAPEPGA